MRPLFFLGGFFVILSACFAQNEPVIQQIEAVTVRYRAAVEGADVETLKELQSPALVYVAANNYKLTRDELLEAVSGDHGKWSSHNSIIESCDIFGDTVVTTGTEEVRTEFGEKKGARELRRFTNVWQGKGEKWVMISRNVAVVRKLTPELR